jgi:ABC-type xylose transport system permease subunit
MSKTALQPAPQGAGTAGTVGEPRQQTLGMRIHDILHRNATLGPLFVLLLAVVYFSITADRFLAPATLSLIVQQVMVVGTLGIAQTLIILTAGIDLSVGAIMVLSSIMMAKLSADQGVPGLLALLFGFAVGTACGFLNGALVTRLKLPPFIVTLGTLNIFFALNLYISVDGGCPGVQAVKAGAIGATSQQYPLKMAQMGVEAIDKFAKDGTKPKAPSGKSFIDTGVNLITDKPVDGVESKDTTFGMANCWG